MQDKKPFTMSPKELRLPEIITLLESLKTGEAQYPPELLAARRAAFLKQLQATPLSVRGDGQGGQASGGSPPVVETALQYILTGATVVLVATTAYFYHDEIRDFLFRETPTKTHISITSTSAPEEVPTDVGTIPTASATPEPPVNKPPSDTLAAPATSTATPPPPATPTVEPTKPGNRYGQTNTPKPEPTKKIKPTPKKK